MQGARAVGAMAAPWPAGELSTAISASRGPSSESSHRVIPRWIDERGADSKWSSRIVEHGVSVADPVEAALTLIKAGDHELTIGRKAVASTVLSHHRGDFPGAEELARSWTAPLFVFPTQRRERSAVAGINGHDLSTARWA